MESDQYPRVLILNETFKSNTGGGITLTNLFKDWPKECLANALEAREISQIHSDEICNNFYSLGSAEKKTIPIFSFLQINYKSGPFTFQKTNQKAVAANDKSFNLRKNLVNLFFEILHFFGIYHILYKYELSEEFKLWVEMFQPDYIYAQLSTRESIQFANDLIDFSGAKLCIHIMDDWPTTISKTGLLKNYWHKKIDFEFRAILEKASVLMSISEGMTAAYSKRYGKKFIPFHNPIDTEDWLPYTKCDLSIDTNEIKLLYAGRIGLGTSASLLALASAIEELKNEGVSITFQIQTTTKDNVIREKLKKFSCVHFNPEVKYSKLPLIFSSVDILVLPIDFTERGIQFLRYSMPTKVSEFMISGTPILLYCDPEVSLFDHAKKYHWSHIVSVNKMIYVKNEIMELITNFDLREKLSTTAIEFAIENYSSFKVRESFKNTFINTNNYEINRSN